MAAGLAGGCGARGPGPASGSLLLSQTWRGPGGAGGGAGARAGLSDQAAATRAAGAERRRDGGVCSNVSGRARQPAVAPAPGSPARWRQAEPSEVRGGPLGSERRGSRGGGREAGRD